MKISVITRDKQLFVDVSEDVELIIFKALIEVEIGIPLQEIGLTHNGQILAYDFRTMKNLGVREGDVLKIQRVANDKVPQFDFSHIQVPGSSNLIRQRQIQDAEYVRNLFLSDPEQQALLKQNNPRLADALSSNKIEEFPNIMAEQMRDRKNREEYALKIAEEIRQKNIEAEKVAAIKNIPKKEEFAIVVAEQLEDRKKHEEYLQQKVKDVYQIEQIEANMEAPMNKPGKCCRHVRKVFIIFILSFLGRMICHWMLNV